MWLDLHDILGSGVQRNNFSLYKDEVAKETDG